MIRLGTLAVALAICLFPALALAQTRPDPTIYFPTSGELPAGFAYVPASDQTLDEAYAIGLVRQYDGSSRGASMASGVTISGSESVAQAVFQHTRSVWEGQGFTPVDGDRLGDDTVYEFRSVSASGAPVLQSAQLVARFIVERAQNHPDPWATISAGRPEPFIPLPAAGATPRSPARLAAPAGAAAAEAAGVAAAGSPARWPAAAARVPAPAPPG
jgi:hypothetical protein